MPHPNRHGLARWSMLAVTALTAAALVATAWSGRNSARQAAELTARGQGEALLHAIRVDLLSSTREDGVGPPMDDARLADLIEAHAELGLRYLALPGPDGVLVAEAGSAQLAGAGRDQPWVRNEERARMLAAVPPLRPGFAFGPGGRGQGRGGPPWGGLGPGHGPGPRHVGGPRPIILELEPEVANELIAEADQTFLVNSGAALALLLVGAVFWRLLRQRERLEEALEHDRRLAALGEMSAVLAHEIRNPLASLKGHAQLLVEALPEDGRPRQKADRILAEAERLEDLTNELLDFVRGEQLQREPTAIDGLLREAAEAVDPTGFDVVTAGAPDTWSLDARLLHRALVNVLHNARQAAPQARATIDAVLEGGQLVVRVRDRGQGLPRGQEAAIFEPFKTTRVRGTGLGLAIARRIVEAHGGSLSARNHPEGGAEFRLAIPAS